MSEPPPPLELCPVRFLPCCATLEVATPAHGELVGDAATSAARRRRERRLRVWHRHERRTVAMELSARFLPWLSCFLFPSLRSSLLVSLLFLHSFFRELWTLSRMCLMSDWCLTWCGKVWIGLSTARQKHVGYGIGYILLPLRFFRLCCSSCCGVVCLSWTFVAPCLGRESMRISQVMTRFCRWRGFDEAKVQFWHHGGTA